MATLVMLHEAASPLTHADVAEHLAKLSVDKATAFRNLNDMTAAGILRRTELGDHVWRFEPARRGNREIAAHPHFLCVACGNVTCLSKVRLTAAGSRRVSEQVGEVTEILLRGRCHECGNGQ